MKLVLFLVLYSTSLFAQIKIQSEIQEIDQGTAGEETLFLFSSGHVAFLKRIPERDLSFLKQEIKKGSLFEAVINSNQDLISIQKTRKRKSKLDFHTNNFLLNSPYVPTVLPSNEIAIDTFNKGRKDSKRVSQCFNRAHIWSFEWDNKYQIQTSKVWLFFTRKYIRRYRFEWWFHVAPTVLVKTPEGVKERVMDIKYLKGPATIKQWTDVFIRDRSDCPIISKYSDYSHHPESSLCYVQRSSPFYYQPVDLEKLELSGEEKNEWLSTDVKEAYREAFGITTF